MKVFLGGTCNGTTWRDELIPKLEELDIDYFNPVVEDWTPECIEEEDRQKEIECGTHIYYITSEMTGVYSIAEVIDSVYCDKDTIFIVNESGFDDRMLRSLDAVGKLVSRIGGSYQKDTGDFKDLLDILEYLRDDEELG